MAATSVERVGEREEGRRTRTGARSVRAPCGDDGEIDAAVDADLQPAHDVAGRLQVDGSSRRPHTCAEQREQRRRREHPQLLETQEPAAGHQADGPAEQRPPALCQHVLGRERRRANQIARVPGIGTDSSTPRTTSEGSTPRICASGESTIRCSSTIGASVFTSSGTT